MINISFNAAETSLALDSSSVRHLNAIRQQLTYTSQKIVYANRNSRMPSHLLPSPQVCLLSQNHKFPTGLLPRLIKYLNQCDIQYKLHNRIALAAKAEVEIPDWAYSHQVQMTREGLQKRRGIIKAPTGSGKTATIAFILKFFPSVECLVTVPSKDLLEQTALQLEQILEEPVGRIGAGKKKWKRVTVGIINSLANAAEQQTHDFSKVSVLIVDECHRAASSYYTKVSRVCSNTDYRLGFSATPWRNDGEDLVMEGVLGPIVVNISDKELTDKGLVASVQSFIFQVPDPNTKFTGAISNLDGTYSYVERPPQQEVYEGALVHNKYRNQLICEIAAAFLQAQYKYPGVILVSRINHGELLASTLQVPFLSGETKNRQTEYTKIGKEYPLVITSDILKEGVDIPQIGFIILAGGGSSKAKVIQQVGRARRKKKEAIIIDFDDQESLYLNRASEKRIDALKTLGKLEVVDTITRISEALN